MNLNERQTQQVKDLLKEVGDHLEQMPFNVGADRCAAFAAVLQMLGENTAAEAARHLEAVLREGKAAHDELRRMLNLLA